MCRRAQPAYSTYDSVGPHVPHWGGVPHRLPNWGPTLVLSLGNPPTWGTRYSTLGTTTHGKV